MTTLIVTPFAPYRDGIATYASQELAYRRQRGEHVEVLSPLPSAAHHHLPLGAAPGWAQLASQYGHYERIIVHFAPGLIFGQCRAPAERLAVWSALAVLARRCALELRIHEIDTDGLASNQLERRAAGVVFRWADRVTVHTRAERDALVDAVGSVAEGAEVIDHGQYFAPRVADDKHAARRELGLDSASFHFVSIGFLQRHKGFDRAVEALTQALRSNAAMSKVALHIVGSARIDHPDIARYVVELRALCRAHPSVTLHERFVSDDEFDLWIAASDAVVLPYREIWSSGVVERARLYGRPIVASDLPQLRDQAPIGTILCNDTAAFAVALEKVWSTEVGVVDLERDLVEDAPPSPVEQTGWNVASVERSAIESQIGERARRFDLELSGLDPALVDAQQAAGRRAVDSLLALGHLDRPPATSARPGVASTKKAIRRATDWQVEPLAKHIEALQRATVEAVAALETEIAERLDSPEISSMNLETASAPVRVSEVRAGAVGNPSTNEPNDNA